MATIDAELSVADSLDAAARWVVPVGMGVLTWLVVALAVGAVASLGSPSVLSVVLLVGLALLALPIYRFRPWTPGLTDRVLVFARTRRLTLAVAVGLFILVRLPVVTDLLGPLVGVLTLPLRAAPGVLFGAKVFYTDRLGAPVGRLVFGGGRLYVEFLWLYALGTAVEALVRWGD